MTNLGRGKREKEVFFPHAREQASSMATRRLVTLLLGLTAASINQSYAFAPAGLKRSIRCTSTKLFAEAADCGCGNSAKISGAPSQQARAINPREAILDSSVLRLDGSSVSMSELLPNKNGVSLVVLTRSFG